MNSMSDLPAYSDAALSARDLFFASSKGVHFFVEDVHQENLYTDIIRKVLPSLGRFEVFGLGGKTAVIGHNQRAECPSTGIIRIYLLDKDFDDLLEKVVCKPDLFYLDDYCIETSIIDAACLVRLCVEERPRASCGASKFSYAEAMLEWMPLLERLHQAYVLVQRNGLSMQSCDQPIERFTRQGGASVIDGEAVEQYVRAVFDHLAAAGVVKSVPEFETLLLSALGDAPDRLKHINGKYLFSLVYHRLRSLDLVGPITRDSMIFRCVAYSGLQRLERVAGRISHYVNNHFAERSAQAL